MSTIKFTKMHGAGNDYIYVDESAYPIADPEAAAIKWSIYHKGVGSDGLILIGRSDVADFRMRMYNNDGSEGMMCGNGVRCVGKFVYDKGLTDKTTVTVETRAGIKTLSLYLGPDGKVSSARVDMGEPILSDTRQLATADGAMQAGQVEVNGRTYTGTFVSMGNPHFVIFVDDIEAIDLAGEGPALEKHAIFPQKCNIEFAEVRPNRCIRTRVWERGTGITQACGTGACATAVAAILNSKVQDGATIQMDGGDLDIAWDKASNHIFMTGPAATVFEGEITLNV